MFFGCDVSHRSFLSQRRVMNRFWALCLGHKTRVALGSSPLQQAWSELLVVVITGVLLAGVSATPCTDICLGSCELSAQHSRIWMPYLEAFVQPNLDACRSVCVVSCNCADTCNAECGAQLITCRDVPDMNFFHYTKCQFEFMACSMICATQCSISVSAGVLDKMYKAVLPAV
ncbi:hypothetical protein PoB_000307400 [Plakobranchus ocellatus]|uniref:Uncharacterized protein n=1 Tax=Plakobranchus ocellatus TaxID=259542 RepID=A0AAV3Y3B4_9GAST|nr:hypothetical protein PoB_000307400 [Plakobranchus ocellatus]